MSYVPSLDKATKETTSIGAISWTTVAARVQLLKPRVLSLVLVVCVLSGVLAGSRELATLAVLALATGGVAGAGLIINQILERDVDGLMARTRHRPLPSGRVTVAEAWSWACGLLSTGVIAFAAAGMPLALCLALISAAIYLALYTPLKRLTPWNTVVGAISGAMPPLIGWAGVRDQLDPLAWILFGILFLWQFPHFCAIAWLWRHEYRQAGLKMISTADPDGRRTGRQAVMYALPLVPLTLLPTPSGLSGTAYAAGCLILGMAFLGCCVEFWWRPTERTARQLLRASVLYLPAVILLMLLAADRSGGV